MPAMKAHDPEDVINYFGGVEATRKRFQLKSRYSIYYWGYQGKLPELRARQANELSGGDLVFDKSAYRAQ